MGTTADLLPRLVWSVDIAHGYELLRVDLFDQVVEIQGTPFQGSDDRPWVEGEAPPGGTPEDRAADPAV